MPSTKPLTTNDTPPSWRSAGLRYYAYNHFLRLSFGRRIQKVSVDAGFTCPNVDGSVTTGGCTFCDNRSFSPSRRLPRAGILGQIDQSIARMRLRYENCDRYIAYFQPATNTYAPVERLRALYQEALSHPQIVGLAIGTRSDCVPHDVLELLTELAQQTYLSVEFGMQTMHDRSLVWMNRGHDHASFVDAVDRSRGRGFEICAHVILGLPGETQEDMLSTARELARVGVESVKIHNLYCVKNTRLADQVASGEVRLMEFDAYVRAVVEFLELIPPNVVVERISGDAPPDFFVGPSWCLDKPGVKRAIEAEFVRRDTWQGARAEVGIKPSQNTKGP
ncbi:MAG TPA: TIGR01212 family radical SAM protein [Lacipirellulaceae bacterium]|nr:TIGR01212 family radical SAM protein [Lacipirellulaceae bacterium]